jgi:predicted MFS family arabinose efflux permease
VAGLFTLTALGSFLFALAETGSAMLVARLLMGAGCAGIFSGAFMIIARFFPPERFTGVGATMNSFAMLGTFLATAPLAYLVTGLGWRHGFLVLAVCTTAIWLLAALTLRDRPAAQQAAHAARQPENLREIFAGLRAVLRTRGIVKIASGGLALSAGNTFLGIWGGPYLNDVHGLQEAERGQVLLFMALAGVAGHFLYGQAAQWFNTLKGMVLAGCLGIACVMSLLALLPAPGLVTITALFAALGLVCSFPTILLAHGRAMVPDHLIGRGITVVNTGVMVSVALMQLAVGGIIGLFPAEAGQAAPDGYRLAFGFVAAMAVFTFLTYRGAEDRPPRG